MERGDHLVTVRMGYTHHGLYLGAGQVIHYCGLATGLSAGAIEVTSLEKFSDGNLTTPWPHPLSIFDVEERIDRAFSRLGEDRYDLLTNNCEHFVNWCIDGTKKSAQVRMASKSAMSTLLQSAAPASGSMFGALSAAVSIAQAVKESEKPVEAATSAVAKTATSGAAAAVVAAVAAPAAIPVAIGIAAGTAALYGVKKIWKLLD